MSKLMNVLTGSNESIEKLAKSVKEEFPDDGSTPRVTVGLMNDGRWYMAIVRYPEGSNESKETVVKACHQNYEKCLQRLVAKFDDLIA